MATGTPSSVAFGALGTLIGYVGAEVALDSMFSRLLWPARFYNTSNTGELIAIAALMPMGGPIHKAALVALDRLITSGLNKGYCRGDMLGTNFYEDIKKSYTVRMGTDDENEQQKEVRNGFWVRVMGLVPWTAMDDHKSVQPLKVGTEDEDAAERVSRLRAKRPLFWLTLDYDFDGHNSSDSSKQAMKINSTPKPSPKAKPSPKSTPLIHENSGPFRWRVIQGIIISEVTSLCVGVFTAAYWKSFFAIWFFVPLLIKLMASTFSVRRQALEPLPKHALSNRKPGQMHDKWIVELSDFSKGFFLIEGPQALILQFFKHYGHPERHRRGINGDRPRELLSLATVVLCILIFPAGLIAFVFAPQPIQWTWLAYQLYTTLAMHFSRFCHGGSIGSTESEMARMLQHQESVRLCDAQGNTLIAKLNIEVVDSVMHGRCEIERRLGKVLEDRC